MKTISITTFTLLFIIIISLPASAYWPTTVRENLAVAADPDTSERWCSALPYPASGTLVVFKKADNVYQIIDRYGELAYPYARSLIPNNTSYNVGAPHVIPDGDGGAFIAWRSWGSNPVQGIVAQRLDSLGNLMWGDSGVVIYPTPQQDFDISVDGQGGFFLGVAVGESGLDLGDVYLQRIDGEGNLLWGPNGAPVSATPIIMEDEPVVIHDGSGGAFVAWEDQRPPYNFAIFVQHLDGQGNTLWFEDLFIFEDAWFHQVIPDGEGGCIVHCGAGGDNFAYRLSPGGTIQWTRDHVSFYTGAKIVPGEPGYFYLGYSHQGDMYGQRMDIEGNFHWPSWPSAYGALMFARPGFFRTGSRNWHYYFPYFYAIFGNRHSSNDYHHLTVQRLDSLGNPMLGNNGVDLTVIDFSSDGQFMDVNAVPVGDGVVGVFDKYTGSAHDVYAKRCYLDGTLGGPLHLLVDLTPHNPPIQIPPSGGSFTYDISIEDTYSVAGIFDLWIEVTLPGGSDIEVIYREDLTIDSNSTILRTDLQQFVPYRAPGGEYTYTAYVGNHEYNSVWSEDSFTFEKLPGMDSGRASLAGMTSNSEAAGMTDEGWMLEGFFDGSLEGSIESASAKSPAGLSRLSAFPNPFNDETEISFTLFESSEIELSVYDISGREVVRLAAGFRNPGSHTVNWKADAIPSGIYFVRLRAGNHSHIIKVGLVK